MAKKLCIFKQRFSLVNSGSKRVLE